MVPHKPVDKTALRYVLQAPEPSGIGLRLAPFLLPSCPHCLTSSSQKLSSKDHLSKELISRAQDPRLLRMKIATHLLIAFAVAVIPVCLGLCSCGGKVVCCLSRINYVAQAGLETHGATVFTSLVLADTATTTSYSYIFKMLWSSFFCTTGLF